MNTITKHWGKFVVIAIIVGFIVDIFQIQSIFKGDKQQIDAKTTEQEIIDGKNIIAKEKNKKIEAIDEQTKIKNQLYEELKSTLLEEEYNLKTTTCLEDLEILKSDYKGLSAIYDLFGQSKDAEALKKSRNISSKHICQKYRLGRNISSVKEIEYFSSHTEVINYLQKANQSIRKYAKQLDEVIKKVEKLEKKIEGRNIAKQKECNANYDKFRLELNTICDKISGSLDKYLYELKP